MLSYLDRFNDYAENIRRRTEEHFGDIESRKHRLEVSNVRLADTSHDRIHNWTEFQKAKENNGSFLGRVVGDVKLINKETGKVVDHQKNYTLNMFPHVNALGGYIVNGKELQVVNQLRRLPGVYPVIGTDNNVRSKVTAAGLNHDVVFDRDSGNLLLKVKSSHLKLVPLLHELGVKREDLESHLGKDLVEQNFNLNRGRSELRKFHEMTRRVEAPSDHGQLKNGVIDWLKSKAVTSDVTKQTLGHAHEHVSPLLYLHSAKAAVDVANGKRKPADMESLSFKSLHSIEDFVDEKMHQAYPGLRNRVAYLMDRKQNIKASLNPGVLSKPIVSQFVTSEFTRYSDQNNPMDILGTMHTVTSMGEGGIQSSYAITDSLRNVHNSHLGFLDVVHVPENGKIGVVAHLAYDVKKKGNQLYRPVYDTHTGKTVDVTPTQAQEHGLGFADQYKWSKDGKPTPKQAKIVGVKDGELGPLNHKQIRYVLPGTESMFSVITNSIPFINSVSANRVLMADRHLEQAVPLVEREAPLVQSNFQNAPYDVMMGKMTSAIASKPGRISGVKKDHILVTHDDGTKDKVMFSDRYPLNSGSFLTMKPVVKTGQRVKQGQQLVETNFTRDGDFALGRNLVTAMMPWRGSSYEDGFVISESAAQKMTSEHKHEFVVEKDKNVEVSHDKLFAHFPEERARHVAGRDQTLPKVGQILKPGDIVIPSITKVQVDPDTDYGRVHKALRSPYRNTTQYWDNDVNGEVIKVVDTHGVTKVYVKTHEPMVVGDKLSSRAGSKGIVSSILPNDQMPRTADGRIIDVLFNPYGMPGRVNPSLSMENAASKLARKNGKVYLASSFSADKSNAQSVLDELKKHGLSDTEDVVDPTHGKTHKNIQVGENYWVKLRHQVAKKFSARSHEGPYTIDERPARGGSESAQSIGPLEVYSLLAGGNTSYLKDVTGLKSNKNTDYWSAFQMGLPTPRPKTPHILEKFETYLRGAGINLSKHGDTIKATPFTDAQILQQSRGAVASPNVLRATKDGLEPERGGLFDKGITGGFDACFHGSTKVLTDRGWLTIQRIVEDRLDVQVLSHTEAGELVWKPVTNWWKHRRREALLRLEYALDGAVNGHARRAVFSRTLVTPNHKIAVGPQQYLRADQLDGKTGLVPSHALGDYQKQVVAGSMLGDGHIDEKGHWQILQSQDHRAWFDWQRSVCADWIDHVRYFQTTDGRLRCAAKTFSHSVWTELRDRWYINGVKTVPEDLDLTPLTLAVWFGDDGTVRLERGVPYASFCTHNFEREDVDKLVAKLAEVGIAARVGYRNKKYTGRNIGWPITLSKESSAELLLRIAPYQTADVAAKWKTHAWGASCVACGNKIPTRKHVCNACLLDEVHKYEHRRDFDRESAFESTTVRKRFGSWSSAKALKQAPTLTVDKPVFGTALAAVQSDQWQPVLRSVRIRVVSETRSKFANPEFVYDLEVADTHNYVVQGLCVSNSHWNHIELPERMLNPLYEAPVMALTGMKKKDLDGFLAGKQFHEGKTGGEAIAHMLRGIDVKSSLRQAQEDLRTAKKTERNNILKKIRYLGGLDQLGISAEEAYTNKFIPVIPTKFRPIYDLPDGSLNVADPNHGYREVLFVAKELSQLKKQGVNDDHLAPLRKGLYEAYSGLIGLTEPVTRAGNFKGFISNIAGTQNKLGLYQARVVKRRQDLSGRSTLINAPHLGMDEIGIPEEMGRQIYKPYLVRELVTTAGLKPLDARKEVEEGSERVKTMLGHVMRERPVLINRAPSLHKFSAIPLRPHPVAGKAIQLNPLVYGGLNADVDGDTLGVHVPHSELAREELLKHLPSKDLFSPKTGDVQHMVGKEATLGLYMMTRPKDAAPTAVSSEKEAIDLLHRGKLELNDPVTFKGKVWTPGHFVLNTHLPDAHKLDNTPLTGGKWRNLANELAQTHPQEAGKVIDAFKDHGFDASTRLGFSVSLKDMTKYNKERDAIANKVHEMAKKDPKEAIKWGLKEIEKLQDKIPDTDPYALMTYKSGASNKHKQGVRQMTLAPVGFTDPDGEILPVPIMKSYADGLDSAQYWATIPSSRKGIADRAVSTQETGAFAKELLNTTIGLRINAADCGTHRGIPMAPDHPDIVGRYLAGPKPVLITQQMAQKLRQAGKPVQVRSPVTCQLQDGICQHCMGLNASGKPYEHGFHIGALAGTTISEPITQMVLRNFHTGGAIGGKEVGFKRIRQIFSMPENIKGKATLAEHSGEIQQVKDTGRGGWDVYIDGLRHFVPKETGLRVKVGDTVKRGDALSEHGVLKLQEVAEFRGHDAARDQLIHDLDTEMSSAGQNIRRRIYEVAAKPMVDKVKIVDPGDAHDHLVEGDVVNVNYVKQLNQRLKKPVEYQPIIMSVKEVPFSGGDFLGPLMYQRLPRTMSQAPALGFESKLKGPGSHPIVEYAYGGSDT